MHDQEYWIREGDQVGAFDDDHFIGNSGRHMRVYIKKEAFFDDPALASYIGSQIAEIFHYRSYIQTVIAPALGGITLAQWVAYHLGRKACRVIYATYAEKKDDKFIIREGHLPYIQDRSILVMEDTVTTGGSLEAVIQVTKSVGGIVRATGSVFKRGEYDRDDYRALCDLTKIPRFDTWEPADCPLCKQGIPLSKRLGHAGKK